MAGVGSFFWETSPSCCRWGVYGTRSQTVLVVADSGAAELRERYMDLPGGPWRQVRHAFRMRLS